MFCFDYTYTTYAVCKAIRTIVLFAIWDLTDVILSEVRELVINYKNGDHMEWSGIDKIISFYGNSSSRCSNLNIPKLSNKTVCSMPVARNGCETSKQRKKRTFLKVHFNKFKK